MLSKCSTHPTFSYLKGGNWCAEVHTSKPPQISVQEVTSDPGLMSSNNKLETTSYVKQSSDISQRLTLGMTSLLDVGVSGFYPGKGGSCGLDACSPAATILHLGQSLYITSYFSPSIESGLGSFSGASTVMLAQVLPSSPMEQLLR